MRAVLSEAPPGEQHPDVRSYADAIARALINKALAGDVAAAKEIAGRTEGRARQAVVLTSTEREKLELAAQKVMEEAECSWEEAVSALGIFMPKALTFHDSSAIVSRKLVLRGCLSAAPRRFASTGITT